MIVRNNLFLQGVSGKAKNLVVKQYSDKTIITSVPDMSKRVLTDKQLHYQELMKFAIETGQAIMSNPRLKEKACEVFQVPANKLFRKIVKEYLLNKGNLSMLEENEQEKTDKHTLHSLVQIIRTEIPEAEILLFGNRVKGSYEKHSDWDFLILTTNEYPKSQKWELQEKLSEITIPQGARTNVLLAEKSKWYTEKQYEILRKKIEENSIIQKLS